MSPSGLERTSCRHCITGAKPPCPVHSLLSQVLMSASSFNPFDCSPYSEVECVCDPTDSPRSPSPAPQSPSPASPARLPSPAASSADVLVVADSPSPQRAPSPVPSVEESLRPPKDTNGNLRSL